MAKNKTTAVAVKEEVSEADIALCLSQRYADAAKTITERPVVFGATLMQAEAELQKRGLLGGFHKKGDGLKGWLADHCKEIDYKTAMRWKGLAFQMAQGLMSKDKKATLKIEDIIKLIEGRDDEIEAEVPKAITKQRDELMAAPTVRKFVQQMFDFSGGKAKGAGGRPKAKRTDFTMPAPEDAAANIWAGIKATLENSANVKSIEDLNPAIADKMAAVLRRLLKKFENRAAEA